MDAWVGVFILACGICAVALFFLAVCCAAGDADRSLEERMMDRALENWRRENRR